MKNSLKKIINNIEKDMLHELENANINCRIMQYGSFDIDPKNLVFWVCVNTDEERGELRKDKKLLESLRETLTKNEYPADARSHVSIGFESQETVDRESNGNWWEYFR
ncbi:hypothetical protein KJ708_07500 [bacterium]|nr:hypothetical protein [bacterium]